VFQFGELVPELTVVENVELPLRLAGLSSRRSRPEALAILERLGVEDCAQSRFTEISGGQAQRVAVARALVHSPRFVFADEPTGSLDDQNTFIVLSLLLDLAKENDSGVVIVTHDMQVAAHADRHLLLRSGTLREAVAA
jgi:putative ABC transport system ATP-binding protein